MYQLLPRTLRNTLLTAYALIVLAAAGVADWFGLAMSQYRMATSVAFVVATLMVIAFGFSASWSPWRWVWRKIPAFNSIVYPDLNGIWVGSTSSNWPVITTLRDAAKAQEGIDPDHLDHVPLREGGMAVHIKAHLFKVQITARVSDTSGSSESLVVSADHARNDGGVVLSYLYEQETPDPRGTDETSHKGAAELRFASPSFDTGDGVYWTRRSWRQGMNTAGRIKLRKVSNSLERAGGDLLKLANDEAARLNGGPASTS